MDGDKENAHESPTKLVCSMSDPGPPADYTDPFHKLIADRPIFGTAPPPLWLKRGRNRIVARNRTDLTCRRSLELDKIMPPEG